jgi:hypothetical protein
VIQMDETPRPAEEYVRRQPREAHTIVASNIRMMEQELDSVAAKLGELRRSEGGLSESAQSVAYQFSAARNKLSEVGKSYDRLSALYEASKYIISGFDLEKRLNLVMDSAIEVLQAERNWTNFPSA